MEFSVVQSAPGEGRAVAGAVVWRTCLREIAFVPHGTPALNPITLHDEAAYAHLLEVICGLASPIVGETEVMAQFKSFVATLPVEFADLRQISERLLLDARTVRARHLTGLGSRSYGSAVRRHLHDCSRVALIGTGILAKEVLPFLPEHGRVVDVWGRRDSPDWDVAGATYRRWDRDAAEVLDGRCAVVIAAPMATADVTRLLRRYTEVVRAIDLRGEPHLQPPPGVPVVTLAEVFSAIATAAETTARQAAVARSAIRDCARAFATRAKLYPSGWHDLCA